MMRACLVWDPAAGLDDAGAGRLRDTGLAAFRAAERVAALGLDLGLVMGSSEVDATPSAAPPQPRPGNHPAGLDPEARLSRPKSRQQRSDQARKPVNSEQDSCSLFPAPNRPSARKVAVHMRGSSLAFTIDGARLALAFFGKALVERTK